MHSGPRQPRRSLDQEVVALRERGQSYSAVASALGIKRAVNAQEAFIRAMHSLPEKERAALHAASGRASMSSRCASAPGTLTSQSRWNATWSHSRPFGRR